MCLISTDTRDRFEFSKGARGITTIRGSTSIFASSQEKIAATTSTRENTGISARNS